LPRGTETILIVEDEEDVLSSMVSRMSDRGYQILVGRNGQEGWQVFQREQERIDLVIPDLSRMGGVHSGRHIPILRIELYLFQHHNILESPTPFPDEPQPFFF